MFESLAHALNQRGGAWTMATWWPSDSYAAKQRSLLHLLAVSHAERLEMSRLVEGLAQEHRGWYRFRLMRLAKRLSEGTPLVEALEQTPEVLPDHAVLAIRFGSQTGTLQQTLQQLLSDRDAAGARARLVMQQSGVYALLMAIVVMLCFAFLFVFIVPVLNEVLGSLELGPSTLALGWMNALVEFVIAQAPLLILALILAGWLIWAAPSRRFFRHRVAPRWIRGARQTHSAHVLQLLAIAIEAGRPLASAISTLARYHVDKEIRAKLLLARNEMEQGEEAWASLAHAQLITTNESAALFQSSSLQTRVWTLQQMAQSRSNSAALRVENMSSLVQPAVTLLFAVFVLLGTVAIFGTLAGLIGSLA